MNDKKDWEQKHNFRTWAFQEGERRFVSTADGVWFTDDSGREILDFSSQLMCCNLGHGNQHVNAAIKDQLDRVAYAAPGFATEPRARLAQLLHEIAPPNLERTFFSTSGTEANEAAIKIARLYTGKHKFISRYRSYHGSTYGSIGLTGDPRRIPAEPTIPGMIKAPDHYCYRCPFGLSRPSCGLRCVEYIDEMLYLEGDSVAAVVVEPVVGSNGILVPPDGYLQRLREITRAHGALLVADEVMSGFGRTGKWFAVNYWGIEPDIMTIAKGITSAYIPLGATMVSKEISEFFQNHHFTHGHTYSGHPVACAAGVAAIEVYREQGLIDRARSTGAYLKEQLEQLAKSHPSIGDVRGIGLFCGVELVKSRQSKKPFTNRNEKLTRANTVPNQVCQAAMQEGVYIVNMINTLIIAPPLIIKKEEINRGISVLDRALQVADSMVEE